MNLSTECVCLCVCVCVCVRERDRETENEWVSATISIDNEASLKADVDDELGTSFQKRFAFFHRKNAEKSFLVLL